MVITKLEKCGKKIRVWLNDEPSFSIYPSEVREFHLEEGKELSDQEKEHICSAVLSGRAKLRCMHLLEKQDRSEMQLRWKLQADGYPPGVIDEAVSYVQSYRYQDDLRMAVYYTQNRQASKSRAQIRADLLRRGIDGRTIDEAFAQCEPEDPCALIRMYMDRKHLDPETADRTELDRFIRAMLRKGFSFQDVRKCLENCRNIIDIP